VNGVQFGDLPGFIDYGYLTRATRVVGSSLAALARAPEAPVNLQEHVGSSPSNTLNLSWDANPESDVVGYEVVWRNAVDQMWTHVIPVGNVTSFTTTSPNSDSHAVRRARDQPRGRPESGFLPDSRELRGAATCERR
jgi:hypothetical protein